jgi:hypothetical protein
MSDQDEGPPMIGRDAPVERKARSDYRRGPSKSGARSTRASSRKPSTPYGGFSVGEMEKHLATSVGDGGVDHGNETYFTGASSPMIASAR